MAKKNYRITVTRYDINKAMFEKGNIGGAAKELGMTVSNILARLRLYRKAGQKVVEVKPDKNFKDPFPSRNIHHPDKPDNFGHWNYKHHWMDNPEEATVGKLRFPYVW